MIQPDISARRIGSERQPVVVVDGFHPDPDALRRAAAATAFVPALHHYPGIRAPLPADYFTQIRDTIVPVIRQVFGHDQRIELIDASFSIVTTPPASLSVAQRLPHFDALEPGRIAMVHYLDPAGGDGTAFFRHRATGFETIDHHRAPGYFAAVNGELHESGGVPAAYIADSNAMFERVDAVDARYNRAVIYRSALLHSGAIAADAALDPDPVKGRLTVTAFLSAS